MKSTKKTHDLVTEFIKNNSVSPSGDAAKPGYLLDMICDDQRLITIEEPTYNMVNSIIALDINLMESS